MEPGIDNLAQNLFAQELLDQRNYSESVATVLGALREEVYLHSKAHDDSAADLASCFGISHTMYKTEKVKESTPELSLDKVRDLALYYGYSLTKIEYESTDLSGTTKINLKED